MAKTKPKPAPLPTPAQEIEACKKRLTETLPAYLESFGTHIEKFKQAAKDNPSYAVIWYAESAMVSQSVQEQCERIGLIEVLPKLPHLSEGEANMARRYRDRLTDELLRYDEYRHSSTNEFQCAANRFQFRAKQYVCAVLRWLVWEHDYLQSMYACQARGDTVAETDSNPNQLL